MKLKVDDIKWLHVEPTSKCNAWCPQCSRNNQGFGLADNLVQQDLDLNIFKNILMQLPNLYAVQLCGNLGDPIAAKNFEELIEISKNYVKKIQIHTNGSLRTTKWWASLAKQLSTIEHDVWFGIDGLETVHEIYRQGTQYKKIIDNATSFIKSGGYATWQLIPFDHNEHQIKECIKTSQQLGFKKFKLVKSLRNTKNIVRHYRTGQEYELSPPKKLFNIVKVRQKNIIVSADQCMHLSQPSIYLAANGKLSTCCYWYKLYSVDNVAELLYNEINLDHNKCTSSCGS